MFEINISTYRLPAIFVTQTSPERAAQHHAKKDNRRHHCLLISAYAPITMKRWSKHRKNRHLHRVAHPAESNKQ